MNPFDLLGGFLDRIHKRSPAVAYLVAVLIATACVIAATYLDADGSAASQFPSTVGAKT